MNSPIEHIRVSQQAKDQLVRLKRRTGIQNWNVLCRWAFCLSLREPSVPPNAKVPSDSSVEMTWKVFGGKHEEIYFGMLVQRCVRDGLGADADVLTNQFRLHLHRGIGYLAGDTTWQGVAGMFRLIPKVRPDSGS